MMRSFVIGLCLMAMCGCGPTIITRDNNSLRAQLERELREDDEDNGCMPEVRVQKLATTGHVVIYGGRASVCRMYKNEFNAQPMIQDLLMSALGDRKCGKDKWTIYGDVDVAFQTTGDQICGSLDSDRLTIRCQSSTITPKPGLRHDDYPDYPYVVEPKGTYEDDSPQFVPKLGKVTKPAQVKILENKVGNPRSDEPVFDGKLHPNEEIPAREFDPETMNPNTGFQFKTGEVEPPVPSLQELTQRGCSAGERVLRIVYAKEQDDIYLDYETRMAEARRTKDPTGMRMAAISRDASLDKARDDHLWRLNQLRQNCHRTLHE